MLPHEPGFSAAMERSATVYALEGKYSDAEKLFRRYLEISARSAGPGRPGVALGERSLAMMAAYQGRYLEAEKLYMQSIDTYKELLPYHPSAANGLANLETLYAMAER